ncbi:MAG: Gfo/Idh/MocA family oxidoreductase [Kofleriaceae bacterium]
MNKHRVGIIGCGKISSAHLKAWRRIAGFSVGGVFDVNRALAEERAKEFSVDRVFGTLDELLAECDVVDVCTPPQTHAAISRQVLTAGRHLLIEKPVVTEVADWDSLVELVKRSPGKLAVIHNLKFAQSVRTAKQWVDQGRIGDVLRIQREFLTSPSTDRMLVGDGHWSHKLPGGRWFETLPHELYLTHWFAGPLAFESVSIAHTAKAPPGAPADEVTAVLRGDTTLATVHFSANCEQNRRIFTVQGSHGQIVVDILSDLATITTIHDAKWKRAMGMELLGAGQTLLRAIPDRSRYALERVRGASPHSRAIDAFAREVLGQGEPATPFEEIDYVVRNCDRIGRAIDEQLAARGVHRGAAAT